VAVSLDQLPADIVSTFDGRWRFQLADRINGHHGGANFVDGVTVEPIDNRVLKRFICAHGNAMVGAVRVSGGEPCELGDVSALVPKPAVETKSEEQPATDEASGGDAGGPNEAASEQPAEEPKPAVETKKGGTRA
jgi:hypothetical protein